MPVYASSTASPRRGFFEGEDEGSVGRAYCAHPTRSPWVGKYTTVGTHSGREGEWSDDGGETATTGVGDSEGHEKSIKERGVGVAAGTWHNSMYTGM